MSTSQQPENLWLAEALWDLGAIQFGDFTVGRTTMNSPIYINLRLLTSNPTALERAASVMWEEVTTLRRMARPRVQPFQRVTGLPFGGLHLALAFALKSNIPLIYIHPPKDGQQAQPFLEGIYNPGETALLVDDLITSGGNAVSTAQWLDKNASLSVRDVVVLIDRDEGGRERLKRQGLNLVSILTLETILNYLMASDKIEEAWYRKSINYIAARRTERTTEK